MSRIQEPSDQVSATNLLCGLQKLLLSWKLTSIVLAKWKLGLDVPPSFGPLGLWLARATRGWGWGVITGWEEPESRARTSSSSGCHRAGAVLKPCTGLPRGAEWLEVLLILSGGAAAQRTGLQKNTLHLCCFALG